MFGKKTKSAEDMIQENLEDAEKTSADEGSDDKKQVSPNLDIEITKIMSQLEALKEVRKANSERFSQLNEQIGELRGNIVDITRSMSDVEISSKKAVDKVEAVQPQTLLSEEQKIEGKVEALKANVEANEAMMKDVMEELKKIKGQMSFYKGTEQIVNLHKEIKNELMDIKKVEASTMQHADKVEDIFVEVEKKFSEFESFSDDLKILRREMEKIQGSFDKMKVQIDKKAAQNEVVDLMNKFNSFEKHTRNILKLLDERSHNVRSEINTRLMSFRKLIKELESKTKKGSINLDDIVKPVEKTEEIEKKKTEKGGIFSRFKKGNKSNKGKENAEENDEAGADAAEEKKPEEEKPGEEKEESKTEEKLPEEDKDENKEEKPEENEDKEQDDKKSSAKKSKEKQK